MIRLVQVLIFIAILNISGNCFGQSDFIIAGDSVGMLITTLGPYVLGDDEYDGEFFYYIDVDNDNNDDFRLRFEEYSGPSYLYLTIDIKGLNTNKVAYDTTINHPYGGPFPMAEGVMQGDTIDNSITFLPIDLTIKDYWSDPNDDYWSIQMSGGDFIPVCLNDGGDVCTYGWIKIGYISGSYISIESFAIEIVTSLQEFENISFKVYPNPAIDLITVSVNETVQVKKVRVYSVSGQIIIEKEMPEHNLQFDVSELQSGMYLLEFETDDGFKEVKRLIIEH